MKVVILCGGLGTRLSEETKKIPKPMVKIGNKPMIVHIMERYAKYNYKDFILALGYKKNIIIDYFKKNKFKDWNIKLVDTGLNSLTGTRLLKLKNHLNEEKSFFLTYGDGISNVNLKELLKFHKKKNKVATLTAVKPPARFGELFLKNNVVKNFEEKNQINSGWINGGFFVFTNEIFRFIPKQCMLEREPIRKLTNKKELIAFKHNGFWQCMDTLRDKKLLCKLWKSKKNKW
jgi:glucose-1-phosphate cytidylyltransferase